MSVIRNIYNNSCRCTLYKCLTSNYMQMKELILQKQLPSRFLRSKSFMRSASYRKVECMSIINNKRQFQTSNTCEHPKDSVSITFVDRNGNKIEVEADIGDTLLDVAKDNDIDGVEGACGGTLACSTCHCIFKQEDFDKLGLEEIDEEELDMLDLAFGLTDTSRLVCALEVTEEMDGIEITVPTATNDARDT
ncbi:2Fe-2S ferredoxin-like [Hydractinia symbiolongicarpus]|uniref:2Fe-2S ferredoxin-like n=1 Tax=Hydractinia symbiolongicarpus TaxID=13093 RepID=UPI00254CDA63|nr:2Fe-2S ferredoxin-like [Hydractinia symbiolongicarpus]